MGCFVSRPAVEGVLRPEAGRGEAPQRRSDVPSQAPAQRHVRHDEVTARSMNRESLQLLDKHHRDTRNLHSCGAGTGLRLALKRDDAARIATSSVLQKRRLQPFRRHRCAHETGYKSGETTIEAN